MYNVWVYMTGNTPFYFEKVSQNEHNMLMEWYENKSGEEPEIITFFNTALNNFNSAQQVLGNRFHIHRDFVQCIQVAEVASV